MNIPERILFLHPDAKFMCRENDYNRIEWHPENQYPLPSIEELQAINQADIDLSQKDAKAADMADVKNVALAILEAVFDMKQNPGNYPTAGSLKQKALQLYRAKL